VTAVNHYPDRFVPGYAPDPRRPNACDPLRAARDIGSIERMLPQCPDTVFIGHAPGFWREISGDADEHAELYPKDRILYGRDLWENVHLEFLRSLALPAAIFETITAGNALRLVPP